MRMGPSSALTGIAALATSTSAGSNATKRDVNRERKERLDIGYPSGSRRVTRWLPKTTIGRIVIPYYPPERWVSVDQRKPGSPAGVRNVPTRSPEPVPVKPSEQGATGLLPLQSGRRPVYQVWPKNALGPSPHGSGCARLPVRS